jgi:hypothetical protein
MDLRFAHMHKQHSHSIIRSFESLSAVTFIRAARFPVTVRSIRHHCMQRVSLSKRPVSIAMRMLLQRNPTTNHAQIRMCIRRTMDSTNLRFLQRHNEQRHN